MENKDFINKYKYYDWINISNGIHAAIAKYRQFQEHVEYNNNPMIEALPPIFSQDQFIDLVAKDPIYDPSERELEAHHRFHYIERLSRYFDPLSKTIYLHQTICVLLMSGYISRNPLLPKYVRRSRQIYEAIQAKDGHNLEDYIKIMTTQKTASGLTIIGDSGLGKSTNLANILELYPQVIIHPQHSVTQIVWLKVDCPHAGSVKGLCTDIFLEVDKLLGTDEIITIDLIHQVAEDALYLVKPMLDAIRSGDPEQMKKYRDIAPLDITEYREKCLNVINFNALAEMRRQRRNQKPSEAMSPFLKQSHKHILDCSIYFYTMP